MLGVTPTSENARFEQNYMLVGKFLKGNFGAVGKRMIAAYAKYQFRRNKRQYVVGIFHGVVENGNTKVYRIGVHKFARLKRSRFQHFQLDVGVQTLVGVEHLREKESRNHSGNGNLDVIVIVAHILHLRCQRIDGL